MTSTCSLTLNYDEEYQNLSVVLTLQDQAVTRDGTKLPGRTTTRTTSAYIENVTRENLDKAMLLLGYQPIPLEFK